MIPVSIPCSIVDNYCTLHVINEKAHHIKARQTCSKHIFLNVGGATKHRRVQENFTPPSRQACEPTFHMHFWYRDSITILDT